MIHLFNIIPDNININFINKITKTTIMSIILILATFVGIATKGLNLGIDFTGGIVIEFRTVDKIAPETLRNILNTSNFGNISLNEFGNENDIMLKLQIDDTAPNSPKQSAIIKEIKALFAKNINGEVEYRKVDYVGPQVGKEMIKTGMLAVFLALLAIVVYLWFRFEIQYGIGALITLFHDAILTIGFFVITGIEFNLSSIAAVLTVIGYSINDTVVVYDRIRENMRKYKKRSVAEIINLSVNATLTRTLLTSSTTLIALLCIVLWGGQVLQGFAMAMFVGVLIGTYSSIYMSTLPVLYMKNDYAG